MNEVKRVRTMQHVDAIAKTRRLLPTEADVISVLGMKGHKRKYRKNGSYTWTHDLRPNDHGKLTREASGVKELMSPFQKADVERHSALESTTPRERLRDGNGNIQYVEPHLVKTTVQRAGWHAHIKVGGSVKIERGDGGMLWRSIQGKWEPTGKLQLGIDGKECAKIGVQYDPDGNPWRWVRDDQQWEQVF